MARRAGKVGLVATNFSLVVTLVVIAISVGGVWYGLRQASPHQVPRLPFEKKWRSPTWARSATAAGLPSTSPRPRGGFARFDPVAQLPWATSVARAWMKDARIDRIDADRIRPDGTLDLAGDPDSEAVYRFVSPSRISRVLARRRRPRATGVGARVLGDRAGRPAGRPVSSLTALVEPGSPAGAGGFRWPGCCSAAAGSCRQHLERDLRS